jgi:hypothetical protein
MDGPDLPEPLAQFAAPAWVTAVGTAVAYGVVLLVMFLLLFVVPFLVFRAL